jgi:hypothetical protein
MVLVAAMFALGYQAGATAERNAPYSYLQSDFVCAEDEALVFSSTRENHTECINLEEIRFRN